MLKMWCPSCAMAVLVLAQTAVVDPGPVRNDNVLYGTCRWCSSRIVVRDVLEEAALMAVMLGADVQPRINEREADRFAEELERNDLLASLV